MAAPKKKSLPWQGLHSAAQGVQDFARAFRHPGRGISAPEPPVSIKNPNMQALEAGNPLAGGATQLKNLFEPDVGRATIANSTHMKPGKWVPPGPKRDR